MIAVLCEQAIEAKDGRISVINVVEQVTHGRAGPDVPDEMPSFNFQVKAVIELVGAAAKGRYTVKLRPEGPSGLQLAAREFPVQFGQGSGVRLIGDLQMEIVEEGPHWIDVILVKGRGDVKEEELLTRMPLNVLYQPQKTTPGPRSP